LKIEDSKLLPGFNLQPLIFTLQFSEGDKMSYDKLAELRDQAFGMPAGDAQIAVWEEAVRLADTLGDIDEGFDARTYLMVAANDWGRPDIELVAYAWCLAQYDKDPERFRHEEFNLLWTYKRVLGTLMAFPNIPKSRIESAFEDYRSRLERLGRSVSPHDEFRLRFELHRGDPEAIERAYSYFKRHGSASELDCRACQLHGEVRYQLFKGNLEAGVDAAQVLFKKHAPNCNRIPHATHAFVLEPLLQLGRTDEAAQHHRSYQKIKDDESMINVVAMHLEYLAYVNDISNAVKLLEKHLPWAYRTKDVENRFDFLAATLPLFARLRETPVLKMRLAKDFPKLEASGEYDVAGLESWIRTELKEMAAQFDARNGTKTFSKRISVNEELLSRYNAPYVAPAEVVKEKKKGSKLEQVFTEWQTEGGDLSELLSNLGNVEIKTPAEARAIIQAAQTFTDGEPSSSEVYGVFNLFTASAKEKAAAVLRDEGIPVLVTVFDALISAEKNTEGEHPYEDNLLHLLYIFASYEHAAGLDKLVEAAHAGFASNNYRWSSVLGQFDAEKANAVPMMEALAKPLPAGFISVAFLDMANNLALSGIIQSHPFDNEEGKSALRDYLQGEVFSYAHSATAALPFLKDAEALLKLADDHAGVWVRLEAAWARAKLGQTAGVEALQKATLDVHQNSRALRYMQELKLDNSIPDDAVTPQFRALAMMSEWLQHPNEFGRPAGGLEVMDTRELFWPPVNEKIQLWLVKYIYNDADPVEIGVGMVGATTFALFGENAPEQSPEDLYALYCAWELEARGDARAPKKRTVKAGRAILKEYNPAFGT
jgi:hypothetical protein